MSESSNSHTAISSVLQRLIDWFYTLLGQRMLTVEHQILETILPDIFGYHFMQIGTLYDGKLLECTLIKHRFIAQLEEEGDIRPGVAIQCSANNLPVVSDSIDVVVLSHVLEFSENPHKILREIERVLIGEGHLVIIGFNPWSLFGLWKLFLAWRDEPPWCGHFFSYGRVKDWFKLLDFELVKFERAFYRPPIQSKTIMRRLEFMEKIGKYCWKFFGGLYVVVVRKRVAPLTPVKDIWSKRRSMIKSGIIEPTARMTKK